MLTVEEASKLVLQHATVLPASEVPLSEALGLALAEVVTSDIDSPPHDKSVVDGYAIVAADLAGGSADFEVLEEVTAGSVPTRTVSRGQATRIMTGAPLPAGADAVVMVEYCEAIAAAGGLERVRLGAPRTAAGQNIVRRATSLAQGQVVLEPGVRLRPAEIGLLAEVGRARVRAIARPNVAIVSTGNELVGVHDSPGPGQIRNSNGPLLTASTVAAGATALDLGIARDERPELHGKFSKGLAADVLIISGGVSAGVLDLVPSVLDELGVRQVFHKVSLKPGKPIWFGHRAREKGQTLVFGLPGNPVSSFVCFELFVKPALRALAGLPSCTRVLRAELSVGQLHRGDRPTYQPARLVFAEGKQQVAPLRWHGSGDLRVLSDANALVHFPAGERQYETGEVVDVFSLADWQ
ncbi:MAG TPA: gephyrin-like molybdotransferase Glp [Pirellulales bacterium]|jgi:molybdopterin molybdotransferase|nr:gephyrin-like molybdotransferase Glp [Pirellulales bacterium]